MARKDNLEEVKEIAMHFAYTEISPTPMAPIAIIHPIFENGFTMLRDGSMVDIYTNKDNFKKAVKEVVDRIRECDTITKVYMVIRKSYRLTFLKYIKPHLRMKTFSELLADAYTSSEFPNQDVNVSQKELARWFASADKSSLMAEDELQIFEALPDTVTLHRGIRDGYTPEGLSWSLSYEKALWFAKRYGDKGSVITGTAKKEDILAYFGGRGEEECIVPYDKVEVVNTEVV